MAASKILRIANASEDATIKKMVFDLLDYMKEVANISENPKTLENILEVINSLLEKYPSQLESIADKVLHPILNFMVQKPKIRVPVNIYSNIRISVT